MIAPDRGPAPSRTLFDHGAQQLRALCQVAGFADDAVRIVALFRDVTASWGATPLDRPPRWSGIADDCSPMELSVAFGGRQPELRVLVEAHAEPASPAAYWAAGQRLTATLCARFGLDAGPLGRLQDLFAPASGDAPVYFVVYHAAVFWPGAPPAFKIYLNPAARGLPPADVCAEALGRLGLGAAWDAIAAVLRPPDQLAFFSLDLSPQLGARVKLYVRHRGTAAADLERVASCTAEYVPGDALALAQAICGAREPDLRRAVITTLYCVPESRDRPQRAGLQMPLYPYVQHDGAARERIVALLATHGLSSAPYRRCLAALATRPLHEEMGIHGWVSLQREQGAPRVTAYFQPRMYLARYGPLSLDPPRFWPSPVEE